MAVVTLTLIGGSAGSVARAQNQTPPPAPAAGPKFGSVDIQRIMAESKARQADSTAVNQYIATLRGILQKLQENGTRFLSEAEIKELAGLYEKTMPTNDEKKRISQLEDSAVTKARTKRQLENTASPTEADKKQFNDLDAAEKRGAQVLDGLKEDFQQKVEARGTELGNKTVLQIRSVIAKVAQEKGLSAVFDNQIALYTSNDITEDVIKQINK